MSESLTAARVPRDAFEIPDRVALRALRRFTLAPESGCHISSYSVGSHGHAQIGWRADGRNFMVTAQRAAWVAMHGEIPEGMVVSLTCHNNRCVNPAHLRLLSNFEAARRTFGRDWPLDQCANGHSNDLLVRRSGGKLACSVCMAEWPSRLSNRKQAAREPAPWVLSLLEEIEAEAAVFAALLRAESTKSEAVS